MNAPGLLDARDSILMVIDTQDGFLRNLDEATQARVVDRIRFLVQVAQRLDIPVIATVESAAECGPTTAAIRRCFDARTPDLDKQVFGLCDQEDLRRAVLAQPRRTAVLVGMETDVCVLHSAVTLQREGFRAVIVGDATASPGENHALGLARAAAFGIEVVHVKGLYYDWARSLPGLEPLLADPPIAVPAGVTL